MAESDLSGYAESLEATLTLVALVVGFIFTSLTLILLEITDLTNILTQAALLVLFVAFCSSMLGMAILHTRIQWIRELPSKAPPPSTPGWRGPFFFNLLFYSGVLCMSISIVLMMFSRGLVYIGLISAVIDALAFTAYFLFISPYRLKGVRNK